MWHFWQAIGLDLEVWVIDGLPVDNLIGDGFAGQQFGCRWVAGLPTWSTIWLLTPVWVCQGANLALKGQQFGFRPLSGLPGCQLGLKRSTIWLSTPV